MKRKLRISRLLNILSPILVAGLAVAGGSTQAQEEVATDVRKVVAKVNGQPIYEEQLKPGLEIALERFRKYGVREEESALRKRLQRQTLDRLIGEELIDQESGQLTVEGLEEKVEQNLKETKKKHGSDARFEAHLKQSNLTIESLRESARKKVLVVEYLKMHGISEPPIPEERIRKFYDDKPENYSRKGSVKVSHILIGVEESAETEEKQRAKKKAEMIRGLLLEGEDFAELAKKHSDCNSGSAGGNLSYIKQGYMPKEFEKVAFALEKDAVSEVVETKFGYHIIKVFDKKSGNRASYEEVREFIKKFLQEEESKKRLAAHIAELKAKAKIEISLAQ